MVKPWSKGLGYTRLTELILEAFKTLCLKFPLAVLIALGVAGMSSLMLVFQIVFLSGMAAGLVIWLGTVM